MTHAAMLGAQAPLCILTDPDVEQLDQAACQVIERVGVSVPSERARAALRGAGASAQRKVRRRHGEQGA